MEEGSDLLRLIREHAEREPETPPVWQAKRRLAEELRRMSHVLCGSHASEAEIRAAAELVRGEADRLEHAPPAEPAGGSGPARFPGMQDFLDRGPIAGRSNPVAPPASLRIDADARRVVGEVAFGKAFEGAPGCVHGGFVAAVLDEALGMACVFSGGPAMTAELTTRFLRHTPIDTPLAIEAKLDSVDGRKVRTSGVVRAGEVLVEAEALFISVGAGKFEALASAKRG